MKKELIAYTEPKSIVTESFKAIRTNLLFSAIDQKIKKILITSANPMEGKSFTSINLAITFAQNDQKTLLVDCDLRKGRLHEAFQVENGEGLSNLLIEEKLELKKYVKKSEIKNLDILSMGAIPPNPSELLGSNKFLEFLKQAEKEYDMVVFDSTPINKVSDALIIASKVDAVLLVTAHSKTKNTDLQHAIKSINNVGGKLTGIIINKKKISKKAYYGKYYHY